jgi:hypothetical protein
LTPRKIWPGGPEEFGLFVSAQKTQYRLLFRADRHQPWQTVAEGSFAQVVRAIGCGGRRGGMWWIADADPHGRPTATNYSNLKETD